MKVLTPAEARILITDEVKTNLIDRVKNSMSPFTLVEFSRQVVAEHFSIDSLKDTYVFEGEGKRNSLESFLRFMLFRFMRARSDFEYLGNGEFTCKRDIEIVEDDEVSAEEKTGSVYAYSFPHAMRMDGAFPIKIGYTDIDVEKRVNDQVKGSMYFEAPVILASWKDEDAHRLERAIHGVLKRRARHIAGGSGTEWFLTTLEEVQSIIDFVRG